jgi:UDP-N-acetylmuramoylalanine--D-glutamate ligase
MTNPLHPLLHGRQVLVLGLGATGLAMARTALRAGAARVQVWDSREQPPHAAVLAAEWPQVMRLHGEPSAAWLQDQHLVLKSPGLAPTHAAVAPLLAAAQEQAVPVWGELDLFAAALAELEPAYLPQLIAITGTNGKTTTTALTQQLLQRAGRRAVAAGNVGPTMLDTLAAVLEQAAEERPEVWVLELSSFQLADMATSRFAPDAAVVLNISQDHLDWHGSLAAYQAAKARIFGPAVHPGVVLLNRDDAAVMAMAPREPTPPVKGSKHSKAPLRPVLHFSLSEPQAPGDYGLVTEAGMAWLVRALPLEPGLKLKAGAVPELHLQRLMPADALRIRGRHNAANALAALALAQAVGAPLAPMLHGLREYAGEPHRVQPVAVLGGVEAYDDSKGTNVGATVAALQGLGAEKAPGKLVLVLGGDGKGQDFLPLREPLQRHVRAVALIGRDAPAIAEVVQAAGVPAERCATLPHAVAWCFEQARSGDAVLLSPACASLDMFSGYAERAAVFVQAVHECAQRRGEVLA